jgi:HEPN domain-containing protein
LPRKTDSNNPADWLFLAESDVEAIQLLATREIGHPVCQSKLAEALEKILKAELIRTGWFLEKTHDLEILLGELEARKSDLVPQVEPLCDALAEVYFSNRYPGFDLEDADWPAFRILLEQVAKLLQAVKARIPPGK